MSEKVAISLQGLAGKYQPYPEYKGSGVEWLGNIPSHWQTSKLRYMFTFGKGLSITKENLHDDGIPCVNYGEIHSKYGFEVDPTQHLLKCVDESYLKTSPKSLLKIGDFVFSDTSEDLDGSGNFTQLTSDVMTFAGYHTIIVRPIDRHGYRFFAYLFDSKEFRTAIQHAVKGVKVFSITQAILRGADIWLPSSEERQQIVTFLDHETARIDQLITKQQQLIELLKEKRQAVITQAVTKGLNPKVPMKNAGVEWLEQVPEHWTVTTLRNLIRAEAVILQDGNHGELHPTASEYVDDGIPFLMANNVRDGRVNLTDCKRISKNRADMLRIGFAKAGDMLLTHKGTVGEVAMIPADISEPYWMLTPQVTYYRWTEDKFDAAFYMYQFQSKSILTQLDIIGSKQSTRAYVGLIAQGDLVVTVPPIMEQRAIREALRKHAERFDRMFARATGLIELLQERRTALISAAVTGKIDLRGWTPPAEEAAA
ncbi:restriction endonuclease subunit S [Aeromonas sp. R10-1]|uniref:restriction endonuclease subunit S n=1 Tax=Aeromonas sp. R10-1 TaxID=3138457 RepID=UPI0034A3253D